MLSLIVGAYDTINWGWRLGLSAMVTVVLGGMILQISRIARLGSGQVDEPRPRALVFPLLLVPVASWFLVGSTDIALAREAPVTQISTVVEVASAPMRSTNGFAYTGSIVVLLEGPSGSERRALSAYGWRSTLAPGDQVQVDVQRGGLGLRSIVGIRRIEERAHLTRDLPSCHSPGVPSAASTRLCEALGGVGAPAQPQLVWLGSGLQPQLVGPEPSRSWWGRGRDPTGPCFVARPGSWCGGEAFEKAAVYATTAHTRTHRAIRFFSTFLALCAVASILLNRISSTTCTTSQEPTPCRDRPTGCFLPPKATFPC